MVKTICTAVFCSMFAGIASAQDFYGDVAGGPMLGPASVGSNEPLFPYDDQDPWKHGYLKVMPFYGGYHFGRPYNYHHVFAQTQTSVGWGMPHGLPYSQQWWHRFDAMGDPGRAQTEPNGYYGYAPPASDGREWAAAPGGPALPGAAAGPVTLIAPVQFQQPLAAPGVDPRSAPMQSQALRQYLTTPGAF